MSTHSKEQLKAWADRQGAFKYAVYAKEGYKYPGQILRRGSCSNYKNLFIQAGHGEAVYLGDEDLDEATQMIDLATKKPVDRPQLSLPREIELKVGEVGSLELPKGSKLLILDRSRIADGWTTIEDGLLEFSFAEPCTTKLHIRPTWPYQVVEIRIRVTG